MYLQKIKINLIIIHALGLIGPRDLTTLSLKILSGKKNIFLRKLKIFECQNINNFRTKNVIYYTLSIHSIKNYLLQLENITLVCPFFFSFIFIFMSISSSLVDHIGDESVKRFLEATGQKAKEVSKKCQQKPSGL
ncbi:hypothetical protein BpHYR1_027671 [Brachionus plicatilis]|uniref:Uncharacterized protein n=1 Tax=Brachionus plicatilis TaxID=10195 RepID=A0A3M7QD59_BRAPC|nr:hypothetical protein BpHYR1_027671 [Brachionus plicatilis]